VEFLGDGAEFWGRRKNEAAEKVTEIHSKKS